MSQHAIKTYSDTAISNEEAEVRPDVLRNLNPAQRQAVENLQGPLLVLAGAGTGKTRVLTARIAHILLSRQALPSQILAVTFTNKAAQEMLNRIEQMMGGQMQGLWLGTFHALCVRILRRHAELVDRHCARPTEAEKREDRDRHVELAGGHSDRIHRRYELTD